jgi:RimJ/RimL family protein N-acetyltransferase
MRIESRLADGRKLLIRHAEPTDAAEIVAYLETISAETDFLTFGAGEFGLSVKDETKFIEELSGGRFNFMLKALVGGRIVATCTIMRPRRPRVRHIGDFGISVAKAYWGLGVGRNLCLAMIETAREVGVTKIDLKVREDNARAIRLYESVGFEREGRSERALRVGDRYYADIMMGLCLD